MASRLIRPTPPPSPPPVPAPSLETLADLKPKRRPHRGLSSTIATSPTGALTTPNLSRAIATRISGARSAALIPPRKILLGE